MTAKGTKAWHLPFSLPTLYRAVMPRLGLRLVCALLGMAWASVNGEDAPHWAFSAPKAVPVPRTSPAANLRHPIDAFVWHRVKARGIALSPQADPDRLARRLSLDLRGLPVSPSERMAYQNDDSLNALDRLVDRWLASPFYGERMAQDWLDLARYADTTGHAADQPRTMWLFRDWVIDALNADMPYDQFTLEQLAGDRLPSASEAQQIATGFHRNSMQALGNNPRKEEFRVRGVVDRLDVTGQVWLGLSIACAECHDHTHDPISQKDYYGLFAIFNQVPHYGETFHVHGPRLTVSRKNAHGDTIAVDAQVMDTLLEPRPTFVHLRGNYEMRGERVLPGIPAVFDDGTEREWNRLSFAQWLIADEHPLTARVAVNRAWQQFFHHGLVRTANDFGKYGEAPSHPDLLDWMTRRFQSGGWSLKRLHRDFLTSTVYRQRSAFRTDLHEQDPKNRWLARAPRFRLTAETLRDQALAVSGLLVPTMGGPSVFPSQPEGVGQFRDATAGEWEESTGSDRFRRSLYTFWQRMAPHPAMTTFDAPTRETCTVTRSLTNTPLQALAMLNDPAMVEAQLAFAGHLDRLPHSARLEQAFLAALNRLPNTEEYAYWSALLLKQPADERAAILATVLLNLDEFLTRE